MAKAGTKILVDTSPTKKVVVSGLTKDATIEACIFDLIDNSVDAASEAALVGAMADSGAMPSDYAGYKIDLRFSGAGFSISDNCAGIETKDLQEMVLRFGHRSPHLGGIGAFGVGLNRALFKLGRDSHLQTDTGKSRTELVLRVDEYLASEDWNLPATKFPSAGKIGTRIEITALPQEISQEFADADWAKNLRHEIGRRYARFIAKGLAITVNGTVAENEEIQLRENGPFEGEHKFYKSADGVAIIVKYGQHRDHRFSKETDYDKARNAQLTGEYGWNVLCNERAIKVADTSDKTGWETKFHSEFYGFVGFVSFVGDPEKLPWNTTKTDVDLNNPSYRMALTDMRKYAEKWRAFTDQRKRSPIPAPIPPKAPAKGPPSPPPLTSASRPSPTRSAPATKPAQPVIKPDHHQFRTILPSDVSEQHCVDKHLKVVHEAKALDLGDLSYSGLALMRMLFEFSVSAYLHRNSKFDELKQFAIDRRRSKGVTINPAEEKSFLPKIEEMLVYLEKNPDVWGAKQAHIKHSLKRMTAHIPTLNGAIHNPFQPIDRARVFSIRDELLPMLRHLIEM